MEGNRERNALSKIESEKILRSEGIAMELLKYNGDNIIKFNICKEKGTILEDRKVE